MSKYGEGKNNNILSFTTLSVIVSTIFFLVSKESSEVFSISLFSHSLMSDISDNPFLLSSSTVSIILSLI